MPDKPNREALALPMLASPRLEREAGRNNHARLGSSKPARTLANTLLNPTEGAREEEEGGARVMAMDGESPRMSWSAECLLAAVAHVEEAIVLIFV